MGLETREMCIQIWALPDMGGPQACSLPSVNKSSHLKKRVQTFGVAAKAKQGKKTQKPLDPAPFALAHPSSPRACVVWSSARAPGPQTSGCPSWAPFSMSLPPSLSPASFSKKPSFLSHKYTVTSLPFYF